MPVNDYKTDLGLFSVIADDAVWTEVSSWGSGGNLYTNNAVTALGTSFQSVITALRPKATYLHNQTGTPDGTKAAIVALFLPNAVYLPKNCPTTTETAFHNITTGDGRQSVRTDIYGVSGNPKDIYLTQSLYDDNASHFQCAGQGPYGTVSTSRYGDNTQKYFLITLMVCKSNFTSPQNVQLIVGANGTNTASCVISNLTDTTRFKNLFEHVTPYVEVTDPYANLGIPGDGPLPGGGAVGIPGFPGLTATSAGVIGLFAPTAAQMQQLADFMWTDFGGTGTTVEEILQEVVEALKRTISNPLDYIIGLNIIPSQGLSIGGAKVVRFGFISSGVSMPQLANQYFTVDCGSLAFETVCGDTFLDYAPYSKFSIYLPYIGFKDVDPNDFVGHTIGVVYHGDCVTGGVTAYITKDGTVMYQYSGCCALNVPLSADNWGETISAAINVATGIVAAAASGGAAGVATAAAKGAANVASNPSLLSPQVSHSGAVSGGAGCMGVQYPFVIREAVNFHSTAGFNKSTGYPAYYYKKLGDVTGFTTVIDAHLSNVPMATQDEIAEIESLLESGVIL